MTEEQKHYIEDNIELIQNQEWEKFFNHAPDGMHELLCEAGIKVLEDISEIFSEMFTFSSLTKLDIPNNITSIGFSAFYHCHLLESINIPDSVTSIGDRAFGRCYSLTSIDLLAGLTSIGNYAFYDCEALTKAVVNNPNATFGNSVFFGVDSSFELHGYKGSTTEKYAKANGHKFVAIN